MRNFLLAAGLAIAVAVPAHAVVIYDSHGFETFANGNIIGQDGWQKGSDLLPSAQWPQNPATIVDGPAGSGKVIQFDNINKTQTEIQRPFQNLIGTYKVAVSSFDVYRVDSPIYNNIDFWPMGSNPWGGLFWDNAANPPGYVQPFGGGKGQIAQTANNWMHVTTIWDLVNFKGTAYVNGVLVSNNVDIGSGAEFNGWYFDDWQTVDQNRTPGAVGRKSYIDNLLVTATNDTNSIPEPSSLALFGTGLLPLLGLRRRKSA